MMNCNFHTFCRACKIPSCSGVTSQLFSFFLFIFFFFFSQDWAQLKPAASKAPGLQHRYKSDINPLIKISANKHICPNYSFKAKTGCNCTHKSTLSFSHMIILLPKMDKIGAFKSCKVLRQNKTWNLTLFVREPVDSGFCLPFRILACRCTFLHLLPPNFKCTAMCLTL